MRKPGVLITGASGEIGHGLIDSISKQNDHDIIALDLKPLPDELTEKCAVSLTGDILDDNLLKRLISEYEIHGIYHLAALLSTRSEYTPETAHRVNVEGTLNLIQLASEQARWHGNPVVFLFPSSIAAYGLPSREMKRSSSAVKEHDWNLPTTMYGCNKLYCEQVGRYYSQYYRQLAAEPTPSGVDFRALRFPGLISAVTLPSGGTSDFASEMIHSAAQGEAYACFVEEDARIPFMAMPDAIKALLTLASAPAENLRQRVYNVTSFSPTAGRIREHVTRAFPAADISFVPDPPRAGIIATWPEEMDDSAARRDWGWMPDFDEERAFNEYLIPCIRDYYNSAKSS